MEGLGAGGSVLEHTRLCHAIPERGVNYCTAILLFCFYFFLLL